MKILVTGKEGQIARSLQEAAALHPGLDITFSARPGFDLEDPESIRRTLTQASPDVIVNAAAYTAVDDAEREPGIAERVNGIGPGVLAVSAREIGARLIHLSTDYVFDGRSPEPYSENAPVGPLNVYGRTKLAGEEAVRANLPAHLILRTSWVYSPFGRNFVKTMLTLAEAHDRVRVISDQRGNPTSASDLATAIYIIIDRWRHNPELGLGETYHFAGNGESSWAELAERAFQISAQVGGPTAEVERITTGEWPAAAVRPTSSTLDWRKFKSDFDHSAPAWMTSIEPVVRRVIIESSSR